MFLWEIKYLGSNLGILEFRLVVWGSLGVLGDHWGVFEGD